ncbi:DCC1 (YCL016C) [Zygosaccharomyces parabailii]|nr:DCC1 (YCL016C) [Zygosaccharomyces parabailii]CDH11648.1 related to Sister chromatid cohesion protein DCC1 [Zygosaccharomyces bailii ISA1307]
MSTNLYSQLPTDSSYKLLQLSPELLEVLTCPTSTLKFKAADSSNSDVVLCSKEKTWLLRQRNHSNTVMLMREFVPDEEAKLDTTFGLPQPTTSFVGFARTTFEYETRRTKGRINLDAVPIHNGSLRFSQDINVPLKSLHELLAASPSSERECMEQWAQVGGCLFQGRPCILSADFLSKALHVTLMSVMAESLDLSCMRLEETCEAVNKDMDQESNPYTKDIVRTVLEKYGQRLLDQKDCWKLDQKRVAKWYGIRALRKYASGTSLPSAEFLIKWKSTFPPYAPFDIDLEMLRGWYFRPMGSNLQYLSRDVLPTDVKERFQMLFKLQSQWEMDDIVPFVEELNLKGLKIDVFLMKYARKRRIGKKSIICSR